MRDAAELLKQHEKLIRFMAQPFFGQNVPTEDLLQEARLAFLECAQKWEEERGVAIWTYARPRVFGALLACVTRQANEPAAPNSDPEQVFDLEDMGYSPSPEELMVDKERRQEVRKAIALLPAEEVELLTMWMTSSSYEELGDRRGQDRTTVCRQVKQLLSRIRDSMEKAA